MTLKKGVVEARKEIRSEKFTEYSQLEKVYTDNKKEYEFIDYDDTPRENE